MLFLGLKYGLYSKKGTIEHWLQDELLNEFKVVYYISTVMGGIQWLRGQGEVVGGPYNDYFCPRSGLKMSKYVEVDGGQKRAILCPRSHWMSPCNVDKIYVIMYLFSTWKHKK